MALLAEGGYSKLGFFCIYSDIGLILVCCSKQALLRTKPSSTRSPKHVHPNALDPNLYSNPPEPCTLKSKDNFVNSVSVSRAHALAVV